MQDPYKRCKAFNQRGNPMGIIEAIYSGGVFRPLDQVAIAENQRVRLTIEAAADSVAAAQIRTARDLLDSGLAGSWADRNDISDSRDFARRLREEAEGRRGTDHAA
jgi:predicted DNA-binding antitoxin AbrB/MazE fold protein